MVSGAKDQSVRTWDLAGLSPVDDSPTFFDEKKTPDTDADSTKPINDSSVATLEGHTDAVESVAVARKGKWIVSASLDRKLILWDVKRGKQKRAFGLASSSRAVDFSPDGKLIVNGTDVGDIELWNVSNGRKVQTLTGHKSAVYSVAFAPDGKQLVSCDSTGLVNLWLAANRKVKKIATGFTRVAYSDDGKLIVVGGSFGKLEVISAIDGKKLQTYKGGQDEIKGVAFSPDNRKIVSCQADTLKVWDVVSGEELKTFSGHTSGVRAVLFSQDGDWVVSGSFDGSIKIWDVDSGEELHTFSGHQKTVNSLVFLPGDRLVSGSLDNTIKIWDLKQVGRK